MAANEIAERFAAACWVRLGAGGGEAINTLSNAELGYRSRVSFQNRIITTTDAQAVPCLILPLDRILSRRETAILATRIGTVEPNEGDRSSYPVLFTVPADSARVFAQPMKLSWMGSDLTNPTYMPFGLPPGGDVPAGEDMDLYDAVALLLPTDVGALSGDVCVAIFEHPQPDSADEPVEDTLPAPEPPDPILALDPYAWFRADTWIDVGGGVSGFQGRVGTEGNFVGTNVPAPASDPLLNDQLALSWDGSTGGGTGLQSTMPAAFWDFLATENYTVFIVGYPKDESTNTLLANAADEIEVLSDPGSDAIVFDFGVAGADASFNIGGWAGAIDAKQLITMRLDSLDAEPIQVASTATGGNGGNFSNPPSGALTSTLQALVAGASGELAAAEYLFFDRKLTNDDYSAVILYLTTRYGSF